MFRKNDSIRKFTSYNGAHTHMPVTVQIINDAGEDEDGDTLWRIRMPESGLAHIVPESDLNPAPGDMETMAEKFATLTDGFESPLVACAVVDAVCKLHDLITANEAETLKQMEGSMFHGPAWIAAVKRAAEIVDPK